MLPDSPGVATVAFDFLFDFVSIPGLSTCGVSNASFILNYTKNEVEEWQNQIKLGEVPNSYNAYPAFGRVNAARHMFMSTLCLWRFGEENARYIMEANEFHELKRAGYRNGNVDMLSWVPGLARGLLVYGAESYGEAFAPQDSRSRLVAEVSDTIIDRHNNERGFLWAKILREVQSLQAVERQLIQNIIIGQLNTGGLWQLLPNDAHWPQGFYSGWDGDTRLHRIIRTNQAGLPTGLDYPTRFVNDNVTVKDFVPYQRNPFLHELYESYGNSPYVPVDGF